MKNINLPKGMTYIGIEILLIKDPVAQKSRTKEVPIVNKVGTDELYIINPDNGAIVDYNKFKTIK